MVKAHEVSLFAIERMLNCELGVAAVALLRHILWAEAHPHMQVVAELYCR